MQILHGRVALWACVCWLCQGGWISNPVLARLLQVICSTDKPVSFPFALHFFPYSGVLCNKVFAFFYGVFRKGKTYSSTNTSVHMLWKDDYSSWSILESLGFCYFFMLCLFKHEFKCFILGINIRKKLAFVFHL